LSSGAHRYNRTVTAGAPLRIGISACLLGDEVRYDGGHKRDAFLTAVLGPFVEWVKVCPEVEIGLGTPREPIRLTAQEGGIRLVAVKSGTDYTDRMDAYAARRVEALADERLCGYVLKKDSPSCGMARVKVHGASGPLALNGVGRFAAALLARFPDLPIEEEGRLCDPRLRENFIERIFAYGRLRDLFDSAWTVGDLVRFHAAHTLVLLAHSTAACTELGRLMSRAKSRDRDALRAEYSRRFMAALAVPATRARHVDVLRHMAGYFRKTLDAASRDELRQTIEDYRQGLVPLVVPVTLLRHHVRQQKIEDLADQIYLSPHPQELMLRN
jgi:uncharacterized protein YbgA (DUF1722 family)/uncharacterized protein YbbK (DUF523 family)